MSDTYQDGPGEVAEDMVRWRQRKAHAIQLELAIRELRDELDKLHDTCEHPITKEIVGENAFLEIGHIECAVCGRVTSSWCGGWERPNADKKYDTYDAYLKHDWRDWEVA